MFGAGQRFASRCNVCNSVSESPEDRRSSEHHPAFWTLLVILQTRLLGFIFTSFMICLSSSTVVFSADQVVAGVAGGFQTRDFSMPFVFARALIDLFSFSIQIACFSLKVSSLVFILVCVCVIIECKIQNAEVMDITDTTHSLLLISEELMQQDTADHLERPVRKLSQYLCSHQIGG